MNFKKVKIIIGREFSIRVKKKSFILTTILTPLFFAALMIVPSLMMMTGGGNEEQKVMVVDNSGIIAQALESSKEVTYVISEDKDIEMLKKRFDALGVYALVNISPLDATNNLSVTTYSSKQLNMEVKSTISKGVSKALENYKISSYKIDNIEEILKDIKTEVKVNTFTLSQGGEEKANMVEVSMVIAYILSFMIYMFVVMFGNMVMRSVIDEKSNRIVEVIVSSVKPFELMVGKILGVASVALTQFLIWIVLTFVLLFGFQLAVGKDFIASKLGTQTEQVTQMVPGSEEVIASVAEGSGNSEMASIITAISQINFPYIIGCFLIYFVLGYLLYAAMFAAIGSAVDNEADTQQLTLPVTLPLILGIFMMLHTFQHPDSSLSFWGSIIPFTSPMVMLARIPFEGGVPLWELLLSIGLLLITFLLIAYLAGKIYRIGILSYGKKATWKDLWKWIKY